MLRILLLYLVILVVNQSSFAQNTFPQDTIVKTNLKTVIAKVISVDGPRIVYRQSGRIINGKVHKIYVSHIIYADGKIGFVRSKSMEDIRSIENNPFQNDPLKSGLSLSFQPGYSYFKKFGGKNIPSELNYNLVGISFKLEIRWYLGRKPYFRHGIQLSLFEIAGYFDDKNLTGYLSLVNPGYCGVYKLSEESGLEYSLNAGIGLLGNYKPYLGLTVTPKLEYTTGKNSFGIGYSTFLIGNKFEIVEWGGASYKRAVFHNINLSYRIKL